MADDITPDLYSAISMDFNNSFWTDPVIRSLYRQVEEGKADYTEANQFSQRAGEICSTVLRRHLTEDSLPNGTLYYNIAERTVTPALTRMHGYIDEVCQKVQTSLNEKAGIGIAAQPVPLDKDRIKGISSGAANASTLERAQKVLDEPVINYARHVTDESVRRNADFQYKAGISAKIVRIGASGCCDWCAELAGTYAYEDVKDGSDVFRRHKGCQCVLIFQSGRNREVVWKPEKWKDSPETLELRKTLGLSDGREPDKIESRKAVQSEVVHRVIKNSDLKNGLPITSSPNSISDKLDDDGKVLQRRIYGSDGKAEFDFDTSDHGQPHAHPTGAHKHIFDYSKKNPHGNALPLSGEDLESNSDIIQRGVNYFDPE